MTVSYFAFPDRRESVGGGGPLVGEMPGDGQDFLEAMRDKRFRLPVLLVFQEHHHSKWTHCLLMPKGGVVECHD